jgi:hypothetical protein
MQKYYVLVEEELDSIETQMAKSPMRHLSCLAALFEVPKVSASRVSKLLKLCLYKIRAITQLFLLVWEAREWYFKNQ